MAEVILKNIVKKYDTKTIINNVSLKIKDKEFLVLVGSSGCGKSTILRMIAGLEDITSGEIYIGDKCVNNTHPKDRDIAFVFQSYALYPHMTVYENIAFPLKMRNLKKDEIDKKVKEAADILNLTEYLNRRPKQLSGGQRQRVALGRAIVRSPKVFLMDEPLSNLDAKLRVQMRSEIKKLHEKLQTTFIYVTHDQTEALTMGDRIVVLNNGIIQQVDTPYNVYNHPKNVFSATFMGTNPMNIAKGKIEGDYIVCGDIKIGLGGFPYLIREKGEVLVGVRPEDIISEKDTNYHFNLIKFSAKVDFEENLGSYKNIYFKIEESQFCSTLDSQTQINETMNFAIDPKDIHVFDIETQEPIKDTISF